MPITRRDFLNGSALAIAGVSTGLLTACQKNTPSNAKTAASQPASTATPNLSKQKFSNYPPAYDKLRGNHAGSFDVAHELAWKGKTFDVTDESGIGDYDLVVVGAGLSGLASAYWYQQQFPTSKILLLDNHDDFGGHAKRNEFHATVDGQEIFRLSFGGTESIDSPKTHYNQQDKDLLTALGIDIDKFETYYDQTFFDKLNMKKGVFFNSAVFGKSHIMPDTPNAENAKQLFANIPLDDTDKQALIALYSKPKDYLAPMPQPKRQNYLSAISYDKFLIKNVKLPKKAKLFLEDICLEYWGFPIDCLSAIDAFYAGYPGFDNLGLENDDNEEEPYIYHFPDGNASIARLMVKKLIPNVVSNSKHSKKMSAMEAIVLDKFDYSQLDKPDQAVNIRLNSTVVQVKNLTPKTATDSESADLNSNIASSSNIANSGNHVLNNVMIGYKTGDTVARVNAKHAILACNAHMIPFIDKQLPEQQRKDMALNVRVPMIYSKVLVKNWQAFKKLGVWQLYAPKSPYCLVMLDYPVSMGGYHYPKNPEEPMVIHMVKIAVPYGTGNTLRQACKQGRAEVYGKSYAQLESEMLDQLREIYTLANEKLDDNILAITINRWGHGYSYEQNILWDEEDEAERALISVKQPQGNVHIAGSDADWKPYTQGAFEQAWRAVSEIVQQTQSIQPNL
ncbi:twin-arginine translocation pathway signal protein [Moraxella macacae 0408225]|uniref:Twin-arginine translocation pathway signal protein n=1 Tax=Moraxella macacae 0408225 TaxID=1230338 RepID=L2FA40_9GAMM|nr:NAD(P)-binding protein [Moraxella macacae]ELA09338.1 twin-arginine translocation pathway signal protein [Moraxella macacae 0408225]